MPTVVPAGAKNPMGLFTLRLADGRGEYLIYGSNANFGIGLRVSSGCIRLRPNDIEALFHTLSKGTRVQIINQPIKFSIEPDSKRYIEVHQPLSLVDSDDPQTMPINLNHSVQLFISEQQTDRKVADKEIIRRSGMLVVVNRTE